MIYSDASVRICDISYSSCSVCSERRRSEEEENNCNINNNRNNVIFSKQHLSSLINTAHMSDLSHTMLIQTRAISLIRLQFVSPGPGAFCCLLSAIFHHPDGEMSSRMIKVRTAAKNLERSG